MSESWKFGKNYNPTPYRPGVSGRKYPSGYKERPINHHPSSQDKPVDPIVEFSIKVGNIAAEVASLVVAKQQDYGSKNISNAPGGAMNGLLVRMHDKLARWANLFNTKAKPKHETIEDTLKDIAGYAIIALMVERGLWDNEKDNSNS